MIKDFAKEIISKYENYRDHSSEWRSDVATDVGFFYGKQWTDEEALELRRRSQFPLVINRIFAIVQQQIAMLDAKNIEFRVLPRQDGDVKVARYGNDILSHIQDRNDWQMVYQEILKDSLVKGVGYALVYSDLVSGDSPDVGIEHIPTEWVYVDPDARRQDLYDAEHIFITRKLTKSAFLKIYPGREKLFDSTAEDFSNELYIRTMMSDQNGIKTPADIFDIREKKIRVIEDYTVVKERMIKVTKTTTNEIKYYTEEEWKTLQTDPVVLKALDLKTWLAQAVWVDTPYLTVIAGNKVVKKDIKLPGTHRPIIAFYNIHTGTPYPLSEVRLLKDLNREINKRRSLMINHAQVSTSAPWWVQKGAIDDVEEMERKAGRASAIMEYNKGYEKPHRDVPVPLPNALYTLEEMAKHDIEYTAGLFALSQGDANSAPETYSATLAIEEYGNRRLNLKQRTLTAALSRMGQTVWEYMQVLYPENKIITIVDSHGDEKEIKLNLVDKLDVNAVKKILDVRSGTYYVKAVAGSTMPTNRWAEMQMYKELLQIGAIDLEEFWKKTSIFDREGLAERMGEKQQMSQQLEQMQQALEQYGKELNKAHQEIQKLNQEVIDKEYELKKEKELQKTSKKEE